MFSKRFIAKAVALTVVLVIVGGCAKCYKVTDTATNRVYYTHQVHNQCDGAVEFRDAKTQSAWSFGRKVRLQSAQIETVQKCQCRSDDITDPPCPAGCPK
jgi:hypothetical protein